MDVETTELTPRVALALSARQAYQSQLSSRRYGVLTHLLWGGAWLLSYALLWATSSQMGLLPPLVGPLSLVVCMGVALTYSTVAGARQSSGVAGKEKFVGQIYGFSYGITPVAVGMIGPALIEAGAPAAVITQIYYPAIYPVIIGLAQLLGAALWYDKRMVVPALVLLISGPFSAWIPAPWNILFVAVVAGGTFLLMGLVYLAALYREKRRVVGLEREAGIAHG